MLVLVCLGGAHLVDLVARLGCTTELSSPGLGLFDVGRAEPEQLFLDLGMEVLA